MAGTLIARDLHKAHGAATILAGVSVTVAPGDVLGVVGPNGAGKSTLLRLLAGLDRPDRGSVRLTAGTAGYLPQEPDRAPGERLQTTSRGAPGSPRAAPAWSRRARARRARARRRGRTPRRSRPGSRSAAPTSSRAPRPSCATSGSTPRCSTWRPSALSGGEAARASLAAILLSRFDVLLLDEPTNDLDFDGLERLERFVAERPGGAVIVSHDRAFLERTVTRVLELDEIAHTAASTAAAGPATWSCARPPRATPRSATSPTRRARPAADRVHRQRQWSETGVRKSQGLGGRRPDKIRRASAPSAPRSRRRRCGRPRRRIERLDVVDKPWKRWELQLRFGGGERSGDVTARLERAELRRGSFVLGPLDLELAWGERVALVGPNGSGKTTLVDGLLGRLPLSAGTRWVGPGVRIGALDQARAGFDRAGTLLDTFVEHSGMALQDARSLLAKFGLEQDAVGRPARTLSPGERTRASLALLMASGANWLVLDEPTNHLDLPAIEQLETALDAFDGTLLLVTHDRHLLEAVALDRTIELSRAGARSPRASA